MKIILHMLRIRRVEFRIAELPILFIPILLSLQNTAVLSTAVFWEGVLVFFFLFAFGDMINCLADRDLDVIYKKQLSEAVYGLGVRAVKLQIAFSALAAGLLTLHIAWTLNRWWLLGLIAAGVLLGAAYSVEPIRLKRRGIWASVCLWLIIFVGPMILASAIVSPLPSWPVLVLAGAYGLLQMGVTLVNTAEDYPEDLEAGLKTSVIALGLQRAMAIAAYCAVLGCAGTLLVLSCLMWPLGLWSVSLLLPLTSGVFVCWGIWQLANQVRCLSVMESAALIKQRAKLVPLWFTVNAWSVCAAAYGVFQVNKMGF